MDDTKFHLKVLSREGVVYEGDVSSVTSYNEKGKFDVLAQHENFITLTTKGIYIRETGSGEEKVINFDNALIRVRQNNVEAYVGIEGMTPSIQT